MHLLKFRKDKQVLEWNNKAKGGMNLYVESV